jgi:endonuclease/exonuclease/phosphatase family metal-dependent hydrolase
MTFNIRYNTERDGINKWDNRKDHAAEMVKFYKADFCGMQEALIGQINDLQERLPEYEHFGLGRDDGKEKGEFSPIFYNKTKFELLKLSGSAKLLKNQVKAGMLIYQEL